MDTINSGPIEVGSAIWYIGFVVLATMALVLFFIAPRVGSKNWDHWKKYLGWAIFLNQSLLRSAFADAPSFSDVRLVNAWRVAPKIGGRLLTFRFPSAKKEADFIKPSL